jgi:hypothetical protein
LRKTIRPIENWVTSPPTGIFPPSPIGQSQARTPPTIATRGTRNAQRGEPVGLDKSKFFGISSKVSHHLKEILTNRSETIVTASANHPSQAREIRADL